jgi:hypothetical protein
MSRPVPECGTIAAYARHMRRREPADRACKDIHAARMRDYRASLRNGQVRTVPALGVKRRIQALMAMGFTSAHIARELDVPDNLVRHWYREGKTVYVATYEKVAALFERLESTVGPSKLAAMRARKKGWPTSIAWELDTIDDPCAHPNLTGYDEETVRALIEGFQPKYEKRDLAEAIRRTSYLTKAEQAQLFGLDWRTIDLCRNGLEAA